MSNEFLGHGVEGISSAQPRIIRRPTYEPYTPKKYGGYGTSCTERDPEDPDAQILGRDHAGWKVERHTQEWMQQRYKPHFEPGEIVSIVYGIYPNDLRDTPFASTEKTVVANLNPPDILARCRAAGTTGRLVKSVVVDNNLTTVVGGQVYLVEVREGDMAGLQIVVYPRSIISLATYEDGAGRHVDKWYIGSLIPGKQVPIEHVRSEQTLVACKPCAEGQKELEASAIIPEGEAVLGGEHYYHQDHVDAKA